MENDKIQSLAAQQTEHLTSSETHQVFNQPRPLEHYNAYDTDIALQYWMTTFNGAFAEQDVRQYGHHVGHELIEAGYVTRSFSCSILRTENEGC